MAIQFEVAAEERRLLGKNNASRLRRQGLIPAVIYGQGKEARSVSIDPKQISQILHSDSGHNTIFKVLLGSSEPLIAMIKSYQLDPIRGKLLHADLLTISLDKKMRFMVPIEIVGEPIGVKNSGGIMDIIRREIEVECLPGNVPDHIPINVRTLDINDVVRIAEIEFDSTQYQILEDPGQTVLTVLPPRTEEVTGVVVAEEVVGAEPEVIKKGKLEEAGQGEQETEKGREKEKK